MNDDVNFDADITFGDKGTSKRFMTHDGIQDVNVADEVADEAFVGSAALVPRNQEEFVRSKKVRKPTQNELKYQIPILEDKWQKLKLKMDQKSKETEDLLYSTNNQVTIEESMVKFNILSICNSAQNQYLQLRKEEDGADTWFKDIDNWMFEYMNKIYNWLREAERVCNVCKKEQPIR